MRTEKDKKRKLIKIENWKQQEWPLLLLAMRWWMILPVVVSLAHFIFIFICICTGLYTVVSYGQPRHIMLQENELYDEMRHIWGECIHFPSSIYTWTWIIRRRTRYERRNSAWSLQKGCNAHENSVLYSVSVGRVGIRYSVYAARFTCYKRQRIYHP